MRFKDEYAFLSNFYPCEITVEGITYPTTEHAYQAMKSTSITVRETVSKISTPGQAKRFGRGILLRPDWDKVKVQVMRDLQYQKYEDENLAEMLKAVKGEIIEHNYWHDSFWGECLCEKCKDKGGRNTLGKILMEVRETLLHD